MIKEDSSRSDILIMRLRSRLNISENDATDAEVLNITEGTLNRALEELSIEFDNLGGILKKQIDDIRKFITGA